jgi:hypothetical protein
MKGTLNSKGPGLPSEPFEESTADSRGDFTALIVAYQVQKLAAPLEWYGRHLAKSGGPFADLGASIANTARKNAEEATDTIRRECARLPREILKLIPPEFMMPRPPERCPLACGAYTGACWTASCPHWRGWHAGHNVGSCAWLPEGDAP